MLRVNLLPWRHLQHRRWRRQRLLLGCVFWAMGLVLAAGLAQILNSAGARQQHHNALLRQQLEGLTVGQSSLSCLRQEQRQQQRRLQWLEERTVASRLNLQILDDLRDAVPGGLVLQHLERRAQWLTLAGHAVSSTELQAFLGRLQQFDWSHELLLEAMGQQEPVPQPGQYFRLRIQLPEPGEETSPGQFFSRS